MKVITTTHSLPGPHNTGDVYKVTELKVKVKQRWLWNIVNSIAAEPLKGFKSKLTQLFPVVGPRTSYFFKVMGSKVKITETFSAEAYWSTVCRRLPSSSRLMYFTCRFVRLFTCAPSVEWSGTFCSRVSAWRYRECRMTSSMSRWESQSCRTCRELEWDVAGRCSSCRTLWATTRPLIWSTWLLSDPGMLDLNLSALIWSTWLLSDPGMLDLNLSAWRSVLAASLLWTYSTVMTSSMSLFSVVSLSRPHNCNKTKIKVK